MEIIADTSVIASKDKAAEGIHRCTHPACAHSKPVLSVNAHKHICIYRASSTSIGRGSLASRGYKVDKEHL